MNGPRQRAQGWSVWKGPPRPGRTGMTLLEVMLATVMVLGCVMALSRVAFLARKHAQSAEDRSTEQMYCQNIVEELAAGLRPLRPVAPELLEGEEWIYAIQVEELDHPGLAKVIVSVDRLDDPDATMPAEDEMGGYRLVRWVRTQGRQISTEAEPGFESETDVLDGSEEDSAAPLLPDL